MIVEGSAQVASPLLPDADVAWLSSDASGRLLATTADGRLFAGAPASAAAAQGPWREVVPRHSGTAPAAQLSFGTLSPDGRRIASLAADFAVGTTFDLVVADVETGAAISLPVASRPDGAAPAWLPDGRLLLIARDPAHDTTGILLVDLGRSAPVARVDQDAYGIALSADGGVAAVAGPDGRVTAGASRLLLAALIEELGDDPGTEDGVAAGDVPPALIGPPAGASVGSLALDPSGTLLAVAWLVGASGRAEIRRYRLGPGDVSIEGPPLDVPGGARIAVVAWLP